MAAYLVGGMVVPAPTAHQLLLHSQALEHTLLRKTAPGEPSSGFRGLRLPGPWLIAAASQGTSAARPYGPSVSGLSAGAGLGQVVCAIV